MVIDGCPPQIPLTEADLQYELDRRRPGQSEVTTPRNEAGVLYTSDAADDLILVDLGGRRII